MKAFKKNPALWIGLGTAAGALVLGRLIGERPLRRNLSAIPSQIAAVVRRHVAPDDYQAFDEAVRAHFEAGRPVTKAALQMLAAIYFSPREVDAIKKELSAKGLI